MHITEVLLKNHQIMPYKRKIPINNLGVVKNKCYTNSNNYSKSNNNHKCRKMSTQLMFLVISVMLVDFCCNLTSVNCNIISSGNYLSNSTKQIWNSINKDSRTLDARATKEEYLKSLQKVFKSTLVSNNSFKNGTSIDKVSYTSR